MYKYMYIVCGNLSMKIKTPPDTRGLEDDKHEETQRNYQAKRT